MKSFVQRFGGLILSILSGFDRLRFRGVSRLLCNVNGVHSYLYQRDLLIKEFPAHAEGLTRALVRGTEAIAAADGLAITYVDSPNADKEALVRSLPQRRRCGRVAILSCVESCRTFRVRGSRRSGHIELRSEPAHCQHFYHYFRHEQVGLCYVRLQSWFPFTMWVGLNGREWLCRQLHHQRIRHQRQDNLLLAVADWQRAQQLLDAQLQTDWPTLLNDFAVRTHPLLPQLQAINVPYYWMTDQSEWATDLLFRSADALARLYPRFVHHCIEVLQCRDILRFLGQQTPVQGFGRRFTREVKADLQQRHEGLRAKLWFHGNSVKLYDKQARALRLETTINQPAAFKAYRAKEGDEQGEKTWRPLRKGVADLHRRAAVSQRANERLAESLATVTEPTPLGQLLEPLGRPVHTGGRRHRALNPLVGADAQLLQTIAQGAFLGSGFRNRDLRQALYAPTTDATAQRRQSAKVTRQLALLRAHGLLVKIQRTHRYQLSAVGRRIVTALLTARAADVTKLVNAA